jgi:soluble lytic murein transglycosylase-like protein
MYEMVPYPMIAEFRMLLDEWNSFMANSYWNRRRSKSAFTVPVRCPNYSASGMSCRWSMASCSVAALRFAPEESRHSTSHRRAFWKPALGLWRNAGHSARWGDFGNTYRNLCLQAEAALNEEEYRAPEKLLVKRNQRHAELI